MEGRGLKLLLLFLSLTLAIPASGQDIPIDIKSSQPGYSTYDEGYSYVDQGWPGASFTPAGGMQSSDSLAQYQEFYSVDQGSQTESGPVSFDASGAEPTYLIINGQSKPYSSSSISTNSLWIHGTSSWTQYAKCPMDTKFKLIAFSLGGPATMYEVYPDGHQLVNNYQFD